MTSEPITLESLAFEWGDAYVLIYARDRWLALRRDSKRFLAADTLAGLGHAIEDDYRQHPVPRDFDPPGTADYLAAPDDDEDATGPRTRARTRPPARTGRGWSC